MDLNLEYTCNGKSCMMRKEDQEEFPIISRIIQGQAGTGRSGAEDRDNTRG